MTAARVFDGDQLRTDLAVLVQDGAVLVQDGKAKAVGSDRSLLKHGVTTVREVGGPLLPPSGGEGELRVLGAGPTITCLDRGGEPGAPWSSHGPGNPPPPWSLLDVGVLRAIVDEAHQHGRLVTTHVGEPEGVERSLDAGVDEWAHMPCNEIPPALLQRAVTQRVKIVGTLDTLSHCEGLHHNARTLASFGATFLYGAEVAHNEIPWGIDTHCI